MQAGPHNLRYILTILFARKGLIAAMTVLVPATALIGSFLMPPTYESTVKILLRRERTNSMVSSQPEPTQQQLPLEVSETELNSEMEVLTSRPILARVVRETSLDKPAGGTIDSPGGWVDRLYRRLHRQPPANEADRAIQDLKRDLNVTPIERSSVIQISYRTHDPEVSARVLNKLSQYYIDQHLHLQQAANAAAFYEEQTETLHRKLQQAENDLKRFELKHGLTSTSEQEYIVLQKLADFQAQLNNATVDLQGTKQRIATLEALMEMQPETITTETRTNYRQGLDSLRERLGELELRRTELRQKYRPQTRIVKQIDEQVATLRTYLRSVEEQPAQEVAQGPNELYLRMKDDSMRARAEQATQRERIKALSRVVQSYRKGLQAYRENSYQQRNLSRMRDVIEQAYLAYVKKSEEARLSQALDQRRIANIAIAEPAMPNRQPVSPNLFLNGVLGLMVGLFSSLATAFGLEYNDRPVRTAELVERQLSIKVLAALPVKKS